MSKVKLAGTPGGGKTGFRLNSLALSVGLLMRRQQSPAFTISEPTLRNFSNDERWLVLPLTAKYYYSELGWHYRN